MKSRAYGALQKAAVGSALYYLLRDPHSVLKNEWGYEAASPELARLVVGAYSVATSVPPMLFAFDATPYTPPRLVEAAARLALRLPATVGGGGDDKAPKAKAA